MPNTKCLQEQYAAKSICFGCGPANQHGLRIRSFLDQGPPHEVGRTIAQWKPESYHEAFPGVLNGGIIGALLDCHSNWTAAAHLMELTKADQPPCTVTSEFSVKLLRPTPTSGTLDLSAFIIEAKADRATVQAELRANGKVCATCVGTFVAVKPGHPAFHRW